MCPRRLRCVVMSMSCFGGSCSRVFVRLAGIVSVFVSLVPFRIPLHCSKVWHVLFKLVLDMSCHWHFYAFTRLCHFRVCAFFCCFFSRVRLFDIVVVWVVVVRNRIHQVNVGHFTP